MSTNSEDEFTDDEFTDDETPEEETPEHENPEDEFEEPLLLEIVEPTVERVVDRTPYFIPKGRETTPELREEYRKRGREKKKRKRRKRQLRNAAGVLALLVIPVAYVFYSNRPHPSPESRPDVFASPPTTLQKLLEEGDAAALIKYSESLEKDVTSGIAPKQIAALNKRGQIADKLLELSEDQVSINFGITSKINGLMTLTGFDILNDVDKTISARLLNFSTKHVGSTDPNIRNSAHLGIVASHLHDYVQDSTEENFNQVKQSFARLVDHLTPNASINDDVRMIIPIMDLSKRDDHIREFKSLYGTKLKQCAVPELRAFGALVFDETIIGKVNFDDLRQDVSLGNRDSIMQLESIVDIISANPIVSVPVFLCTIGVVENLRQIEEDELEIQLISKLRDAIPRIADGAAREQVNKGLSDYDIRRTLMGTIFDPSNRMAVAENEQQMPKATVIVFFSYESSRSAKLISSLNTIDYLVSKEVPCLLVCIDTTLTTNEAEAIQAVFPAGNLISPPDNVDYLDLCPVLSVPYIIILDQNQTVVGVNVFLDQVRGELVQLVNR